MKESLKIPHFTFCEEISMDNLSDIRVPINQLAEKSGMKLSYLPFIIKALSVALHEYPVLNSSVSPDEVKNKPYIYTLSLSLLSDTYIHTYFSHMYTYSQTHTHSYMINCVLFFPINNSYIKGTFKNKK